MPRTSRASVGGICYHVLNRGNAQAEVFHKVDDFAAFLQLMAEANERLPLRILGYALMPNHFHLVLWPCADGDLSRWMQWLLTSHVRRYHRHYHGSGHVWQGRFKAFPIEQDEHLHTVLRYVERNPLRAKLVRRAEAWAWSSLAWRGGQAAGVARRLAGALSASLVHERECRADRGRIGGLAAQRCAGAPFGEERWSQRIAERLGIEASLRPRGRPKKRKK